MQLTTLTLLVYIVQLSCSDDLDVDDDKLGIQAARCKAKCIAKFQLKQFNGTLDDSCLLEKRCFQCSDMCTSLTENFKEWEYICHLKKFCHSGCKAACRFILKAKQTKTKDVPKMKRGWTWAANIKSKYLDGHSIVITWSAPTNTRTGKFVPVYNVLWKDTNNQGPSRWKHLRWSFAQQTNILSKEVSTKFKVKIQAYLPAGLIGQSTAVVFKENKKGIHVLSSVKWETTSQSAPLLNEMSASPIILLSTEGTIRNPAEMHMPMYQNMTEMSEVQEMQEEVSVMGDVLWISLPSAALGLTLCLSFAAVVYCRIHQRDTTRNQSDQRNTSMMKQSSLLTYPGTGLNTDERKESRVILQTHCTQDIVSSTTKCVNATLVKSTPPSDAFAGIHWPVRTDQTPCKLQTDFQHYARIYFDDHFGSDV